MSTWRIDLKRSDAGVRKATADSRICMDRRRPSSPRTIPQHADASGFCNHARDKRNNCVGFLNWKRDINLVRSASVSLRHWAMTFRAEEYSSGIGNGHRQHRRPPRFCVQVDRSEHLLLRPF